MSDTRQEFEDALANSPYKAPSVKSDGLYKSIVAEAMWWSWQASRSKLEAENAELRERVEAGKRLATFAEAVVPTLNFFQGDCAPDCDHCRRAIELLEADIARVRGEG